MNNMESLFLTENQVSQIRHRNIAIVLAKNDVTWTVPPANLVPGEATFRFYEGVPVGVNSHDGSSKGLHTIAIYQQGTRHDAYPSSMKISYNMDSFSMEQLLSLSACYWNKKEGKWVDVESNIEGREIALHTNHTTAVGFIDRKLLAQAAEDERTENKEMTVEEEAEEGFLSTIYGKVIVGVVIFVLLLIGVRIIIKKQSTQRG